MRDGMIYYLFTYNKNLPGVNNKLIDKITSLKESGLNIKGIVLYDNKETDLGFLPDNLFEKYHYHYQPKHYKFLRTKLGAFINSAINNFRSTRDIYEKVLSKKQIDYLILRYGTSDFSMKWLMKKLNYRIIFESNTNEVEQLKIKYTGFFSTPAWITYDYLNEKYLAPKLLRKIPAIICVTDELSAYQKKRIHSDFPKIVTITNGIKVSGYDLAPAVKSPQKLAMLMLIGVDAPWHGLDKITKAIKVSSEDVELYVVGDVIKNSSDSRIIFTGQLNNKQISELIINKMICCGIGTLALERKGLHEAAPLKVREYMARGLPVVYSYEDTDIDKNQDFRDTFCVKLSYKAEELNMGEIVEKLRKIVSIENYNARIKEFALQNMDISSKAKSYKGLIESLPAS